MGMIGTPEDHTHTDLIPITAIVSALAKVLMREDDTLRDKVIDELHKLKSAASGVSIEEIESAINTVQNWRL